MTEAETISKTLDLAKALRSAMRPPTPGGTRSGILHSMDEEQNKLWLAERRKGIGGSEAAALFGESPWTSKLELYRMKVLPKEDEQSEFFRWGHLLEPVIVNEFAERTGMKAQTEGEIIWSKKYAHAFATLDASIQSEDHDGPGQLEIKTSGFGKGFEGDELPMHIQIQTQAGLLCTGWQWGAGAWLEMLQRRMDWRVFDAHEEFQQMLGESIEAFWRDHIEKQVPPAPDGSASSAAAIKDLYPEGSDDRRELDEEWMARRDELQFHQERMKAHETEADKLKQLFQVELKAHDFASMPDGSGATYKTTNKKAGNCSNCGHETRVATSFRVLRFQAPKAPKKARVKK